MHQEVTAFFLHSTDILNSNYPDKIILNNIDTTTFLGIGIDKKTAPTTLI